MRLSSGVFILLLAVIFPALVPGFLGRNKTGRRAQGQAPRRTRGPQAPRGTPLSEDEVLRSIISAPEEAEHDRSAAVGGGPRENDEHEGQQPPRVELDGEPPVRTSASSSSGERAQHPRVDLDEAHPLRTSASSSSDKRTKRVFLLRHGEGEHNAQHNYGLRNPHLTEIGKRQARSWAWKVKEFGCEVVLVSPLERAVETALLAFQESPETTLVLCRHARELNFEDGCNEVQSLQRIFKSWFVVVCGMGSVAVALVRVWREVAKRT